MFCMYHARVPQGVPLSWLILAGCVVLHASQRVRSTHRRLLSGDNGRGVVQRPWRVVQRPALQR